MLTLPELTSVYVNGFSEGLWQYFHKHCLQLFHSGRCWCSNRLIQFFATMKCWANTVSSIPFVQRFGVLLSLAPWEWSKQLCISKGGREFLDEWLTFLRSRVIPPRGAALLSFLFYVMPFCAVGDLRDVLAGDLLVVWTLFFCEGAVYFVLFSWFYLLLSGLYVPLSAMSFSIMTTIHWQLLASTWLWMPISGFYEK
jgi:hypothetical protein